MQTAKQTMMQRLRQAEKEMIYEEFKDRAGDIVSGTVRRFERNDVMIDLGKFEGIMPNRERVQGEDYNIGDRIRAYVLAVENEGRGPEIILSRSHPNFVRRLFEAEVNEISDRTVEIRGIAREAGFRTKVAVWSSDPKVDPVGACVGMRGARVKNIVRELNNEKVDIIRWSEDPKEFVREALKPAELRSITVDEDNHVVHVTVDEIDLSKAIGRKGQNARLSSRLMGWDVQVRRDESKEEQFKEKIGGAAHTLGEQLGITDELAEQTHPRRRHSIPNCVIDMPADYIAAALEITEEAAEAILARAHGIVSGSARRRHRIIFPNFLFPLHLFHELCRQPDARKQRQLSRKNRRFSISSIRPRNLRAASASARRQRSFPRRSERAGRRQKRTRSIFSPTTRSRRSSKTTRTGKAVLGTISKILDKEDPSWSSAAGLAVAAPAPAAPAKPCRRSHRPMTRFPTIPSSSSSSRRSWFPIWPPASGSSRSTSWRT